MSIVGSGVATNRTNIQLPNDVSQEILQKTQESSVVMRLARQIALPGRGVQIPVIAGDPSADWVTETAAKPVSNPTLDKKIMQTHKLAVIMPFSNEFRRDAAALYDALVSRLPDVLGKKFDQTVFFGPSSGSLANFDNFSVVTANATGSSVYGALVAADIDVGSQGGTINGYVFSPQGRGVLLSALDGENRPLFINNIADGAVPRLLGAQTHFTSAAYKEGAAGEGTAAGTPDIIGFAGDWTKAMFGTVEGVRVDFSSDATLTVGSGTSAYNINLFQQNMFAVRAEIEVGFVAQTEYFNSFTRTHSA